MFSNMASVPLPDAKRYRPEPAYLRKLYEVSRLTQLECAVRLGVEERTFMYWLSGERRFPYSAQFCMEALAKRKAR